MSSGWLCLCFEDATFVVAKFFSYCCPRSSGERSVLLQDSEISSVSYELAPAASLVDFSYDVLNLSYWSPAVVLLAHNSESEFLCSEICID